MPKIVIDISDMYYDSIKYAPDGDLTSAEYAIKYGTVLPKGHGRLIDADVLFNHTTFIYEDGSNIYDWGDVTCGEVQDLISEAPTIVEADKE